MKFVSEINPDIIYISGWMDRGYLNAIIKPRRKGIPVVCGFDDIWFKTIRQRIASIIFPIFKYLFFSHAWVAGPYQFEYAKRLGFKNNEITHNCLSADIEIFNHAYSKKNKNIIHKKFLYVGRFEPVKGVDILVNAWDKIVKQNQAKNWSLTLIGSGSLKEELSLYDNVIVKPFMQPENLIDEIKNYDCFILPSIFEPWALVLHEFSAAGLPIICSDVCGAAPVFVVSKFNGFSFKVCDINDLVSKMLKIIDMPDCQLIKMSENSHELGQKITPEISAASFISILN